VAADDAMNDLHRRGVNSVLRLSIYLHADDVMWSAIVLLCFPGIVRAH
jgi:hypothetical protein